MVCTNGLIIGEQGVANKWRHIGSADRLTDVLDTALPATLESHAVMPARLEAAHNETLLLPAAATELTQLELTRPEREVALVETLREAELIDTDKPVVIDDLKLDPDTEFTRWHLINGVTASARAHNTERRVHIETQAGQLLARAA
jgi:hypothetical protein